MMSKRKNNRNNNEIRSFNIYEVESFEANSRCFFESNETKIFVSMYLLFIVKIWSYIK